MQSSTFGIDLGTTNSVAGVWKNGNIEIIAYKSGSRLFPSCVAYNKRDSSNSVVGQYAKQRMESPSFGVFHSCKRLLGVPYDSDIVKRMQGSVGYDIGKGEDGKLVVSIKTDNGNIVKHPEDVGAMILSAIAEEVRAFVGFDIRNVVITVPAYFTQYKRDLTKLAGEIAGLNVRAIISEPQAAAYAYLDYNTDERDSTFMIYDLGGGTFDVTILRCEGDQFKELATDGDVFCGGLDFDKLILDQMKQAYLEETGEPLSNGMIAKVLSHCEQAKISLLSVFDTEIELANDVSITFSRVEMNRLIKPKLEETLKICDRAIEAAGINAGDIDNIILVGGSTRLLLVSTLLQQHFPNIPIKGNISPDECVAYGAAKYAHNLDINPPDSAPPAPPQPLSGSIEEYLHMFKSRYPLLPLDDEQGEAPPPAIEEPIQNIDIGNVEYFARCPSDIGFSNRGQMEVFIPRNTELPVSENKLIQLPRVPRSVIRLTVYQGNDPIARNNSVLKVLEITLRQLINVYLSVVLDMKKDGSLSVRIVDYNTGDSYEYRDIQSAMSEEELRRRQETVEQERRTRNYLNEMENIRHRLLKWGFTLMDNANERDKIVLQQNIDQLTRLNSNMLTEELTDQVYQVFSDISERLIQ